MKFKRFGAYLIDIMIVGFVATCLSSIVVLNPYYDSYLEKNNEMYEIMDAAVDEDNLEFWNSIEFKGVYQDVVKYGSISSLISLGCYLLYFVGFQKWNKNQTVGKKLMKIKVVSEDGDNVSLGQYLVRTVILYNLIFTSLNVALSFWLGSASFFIASVVVSVIGELITYAGYLMIVFRKDGLGLHDMLGKTKVVSE